MLSADVTELEKYGFKSPAYKQQSKTWKPIDLVIVNAHFDSVSIDDISKMKIKGERLKPDGLFMKVSTKQEEVFYSVEKRYHLEWFSRVVWAKVYALNHKNPMNSFEMKESCEGNVLIKGSLGSWSQKFVRIASDGFSVRQSRQAQADYSVPVIKQLWTRFDTLHNGQHFVLKFKGDGWYKYEIAVPTVMVLRWCLALYSLLVLQ